MKTLIERDFGVNIVIVTYYLGIILQGYIAPTLAKLYDSMDNAGYVLLSPYEFWFYLCLLIFPIPFFIMILFTRTALKTHQRLLVFLGPVLAVLF